MIKVTLEFNTQAELLAFFASPAGAAPAQAAKVESPKSVKATAPSPSASVAPSATTAEVKSDPKPAAELSAPAAKDAATVSTSEASTSAGPTPEELTKAIVAAVARTSREAVLGLLQADFNVKAGKEITDPAIRAKAKTALEALA